MQLEKILEEIKDELKDIYLDIANNYNISDLQYDGDKVACVASKFRCDAGRRIEKIIRKHMNDGWISVNSHGLPSSSEHDFRFWVTVQYKNGFRRTLKATWNYYNNHFVYQNGKIISEDVVAYRYYSAPKPYQPERSEG